MNSYQFGNFGASNGKDVLNSYIYWDVENNRCGNNVVSCLTNYLKDMRYSSGPKFWKLTIFFDNCVGQYKSKITIWYILCLLYIILFYHITLLFLIRGNPNNAAYHTFILFNGGYHKRYIFKYE